jgi:hypothetical protein
VQYGRASQLLDPSRGCKMPSTKELAASVGTATGLVVGDLVGSNFRMLDPVQITPLTVLTPGPHSGSHSTTGKLSSGFAKHDALRYR